MGHTGGPNALVPELSLNAPVPPHLVLMRVTSVGASRPLASPASVELLASAAKPNFEIMDDPRTITSFDDYYRSDYRSLVGLAFVLTGSNTAAEDICQDALTEAHRRWATIGQYDDPGAWVRRVLVNKSRSRFRRLKSEAKAIARIGSRRLGVVEPTERSTEVWAAVRQLPKRQAQSIALLYWEDRSIAQIAEILECSPETIKTHLKRGRASLTETLGGESA